MNIASFNPNMAHANAFKTQQQKKAYGFSTPTQTNSQPHQTFGTSKETSFLKSTAFKILSPIISLLLFYNVHLYVKRTNLEKETIQQELQLKQTNKALNQQRIKRISLENEKKYKQLQINLLRLKKEKLEMEKAHNEETLAQMKSYKALLTKIKGLEDEMLQLLGE